MSGLPSAGSRRPDGAALVIAILLAALGGLLIWQGRAIPDKGGYAGIGSGDMPMFIGLGLLALAGAHLWKALRQPAMAIPHQHAAPVLFITGGLALQIALLHTLGFSIASGLLFAMTAAGFGKRNFALTLPVGIAFALLVYGVFDQLLKLNLPAGFPETLIFAG